MSQTSTAIQQCIQDIQQTFTSLRHLKNFEYEIDFSLPLGNLSIRIRFPSLFPTFPPKLLVASQVHHPLVDIFGTILYPEFNSWEPSINLTTILNSIFESFSQNPPLPASSPLVPDFSAAISLYNKRIESDSDVFSLISLTPEYQQLKNERDININYNLARAEEVLKLKKKYNQCFEKNRQTIMEYKKIQEERDRLCDEINSIIEDQTKIVEFVKSKEMEAVRKGNEVWKLLANGAINAQQFLDMYQSSLKTAKLIQLGKFK